MWDWKKAIWVVVALCAATAAAQTAVTTSGGTSGSIPMFTGSSTLENSDISQSGGNISMGPGLLTSVGGSLGTTSGDTVPLLTLYASVPNASYLNFTQIRKSDGAQWETATTRIQQRTDVTNQGYIEFNPSGGQYGLAFGSGETEFLRMTSDGSVGIGTATPGAKLEIDGNLKLTSGSGASITFADGTVQSTAYTGVSCGGDYAESVDVTGDRHRYGPGDLLVLDPGHPGDVLKSAKAYSTSVAGIYSTRPGYVGRRQTGPKDPHEVPMAMVGIVPAHVTTENGSIHVGDLLVSSSTPGYAMKGTDRSQMLGAVVGKAAGNLESGNGVIEVLVTLQ